MRRRHLRVIAHQKSPKSKRTIDQVIPKKSFGQNFLVSLNVQQKIIEAFTLDGAEAQPVVVVGVPDEAKGEALVLLSATDITMDQLRAKLTASGLPNLWIPKTMKRIEKIPLLASGKLDLKACEKLAKE